MAPRTEARKKPAKRASSRPQSTANAGKRPPRDEPYHHGDLHQALLTAAEAVLEREGLQGLTLRAVARETGVSHAAPSHHFGDLAGLVSELAAIGFQRFNAAMTKAGAIDATPNQRALSRAKAYVDYARSNPRMYGLMFRTERLDMSRPALREAANSSFAGLAGAVAANRSEHVGGEFLSIGQAAEIVKAWSLIHGFATLLIDGRLQGVLDRLAEGDVETLLDAMLTSAIVKS